MSVAETTKQERMHIRLDARSKHKLERAALYSHKSLSEFVLTRALNAADEVIREHETITLDAGDWGRFLDALEKPPAPNERLREAFAQHRRRVKR